MAEDDQRRGGRFGADGSRSGRAGLAVGIPRPARRSTTGFGITPPALFSPAGTGITAPGRFSPTGTRIAPASLPENCRPRPRPGDARGEEACLFSFVVCIFTYF